MGSSHGGGQWRAIYLWRKDRRVQLVFLHIGPQHQRCTLSISHFVLLCAIPTLGARERFKQQFKFPRSCFGMAHTLSLQQLRGSAFRRPAGTELTHSDCRPCRFCSSAGRVLKNQPQVATGTPELGQRASPTDPALCLHIYIWSRICIRRRESGWFTDRILRPLRLRPQLPYIQSSPYKQRTPRHLRTCFYYPTRRSNPRLWWLLQVSRRVAPIFTDMGVRYH